LEFLNNNEEAPKTHLGGKPPTHEKIGTSFTQNYIPITNKPL